MKFNFKRIASVLTGTVMLSSTIALAAAVVNQYPQPFVTNGNADVAIVTGAAVAAGSSDIVAAQQIATNLRTFETVSQITGQTSSTTTTIGGDLYSITGATKLNIGNNLTNVKTTMISSDDMPNLLAKGTFQAKGGSSYDYEQKIQLAGDLTYGVFSDSDYKVNGVSSVPVLGIMQATDKSVLNYTVEFSKTVSSSVSTAGRLTDLQDTDIVLMGKTYKILNAYNNTNMKLELMAGSVVDSLDEKTSKTYTINGVQYSVTAGNVAGTSTADATVQLTINGETTSELAKGDTYKLKDGTQIGIRSVWPYSNKVSSVQFTLGAEKMTLENGLKLKLNDENVNDIVVYLDGSTTYDSGKRNLNKIIFAWIPSSKKVFVTENTEALMPGLSSIKIGAQNATFNNPESTFISNNGDKNIQLTTTIKDGEVTIPLVALNDSQTGIFRIGQSGTGQNDLVTGDTAITFNTTSDKYFVASWNGGTAAESYLLRVDSVDKDVPTTGQNSTSITNVKTGVQVCKDKRNGDTCTIGNAVLNIGYIDGNAKLANISGGSNVNFRTVYTKDGMTIYLPIDYLTAAQATAANSQGVNLTAQPLTAIMRVKESDKNHNVDTSSTGKILNFTIGVKAGSTKAEVTSLPAVATQLQTGQYYDIGGSSSVSKYVGYIQSEVGTKILLDQKPDQDTLEIITNSGESYGNYYVASPAVQFTTSGDGGNASSVGNVITVSDSDTTLYSGKNLIVIGGTCINTVSQALLGVAKATCGSDFTAKTQVKAGEYLIQTFASPYTSKIATLVAGYNAEDTRNGVGYLLTQNVSTAIGPAMIKSQKFSVS